MNAQPKDRERQEKVPYALMSTFIVGRMSKGLASNLANALRQYLGSRGGFVSNTFIIGEPGSDAEGSYISISLWESRASAREASETIAIHLRSSGWRQNWVDPIVYLYQVHP